MLVAIISVAIGLVLPPAPLGHRCSGALAVEEWAVDAAVDADLDASYSAEHREGLAMASLLLNGVSADGASASADGVSASPPPALIEHSLAISDSERIRCFFAYGRESRTLERVFLLNERKNRAADALQDAREGGEGAAAAATSTPGDSRGRLTLNALLGVWAGDATLRRPKEASFVS